ncbi:MAG: glycoside hydrolase family 2 protein [Oscillospiraceae bacterium]|nr:glycoside hydrolase family 2 protein [Oscillospiraceae bacterium]
MIRHLNGKWIMRRADNPNEYFETTIPASVYDTLIGAGRIPDPYYGENQYAAFEVSKADYIFEHVFFADEDIIGCEKIYLRFRGIDTAADVFFNGAPIGKTENMHRTYEFDITGKIKEGGNTVSVYIFSPVECIRRMQEKEKLWGVNSTTEGFPHIRKAHYMFGWDWGPSLPDMGIWRGVELVGVRGGRIESVYVRQQHSRDGVTLTFETKLSDISSKDLRMDISLMSPDGAEFLISDSCSAARNGGVKDGSIKVEPICNINRPLLWNVRGYGKQDLYMAKVMLFDGEEPVDMQEFNIGLRTVEICRNKDKNGDGEEFCFVVNGTKIFAMGANYIPEDHILARRSPDRTRELLKSCVSANYNMIRVWGGGFYPDDYFYDTCDKLGILVWQDFAFACAVYNADTDFCNNVKQELIDNIVRLRNHASLGMWCGNNEIESAILYWGIPVTEGQKQGYTRLFEKLIPSVIKHYDPQTFYWPSSPSSGGNFDEPSAENRGDSHYWDVWHNLKPFNDFRKYKFRFCSEYGFESVPSMKTVRSFADQSDLNLMSPVMEAHQKCDAGTEKLMYYLAQMVHYPYSFEDLSYATQLVQADAVRNCVEHLRRNRGRCMGSLYWQVNDSNPVISWSSIDYFGRWKALHYYAKKFYAPVLCSIDDSDKSKLTVNISNETMADFVGKFRWRVRRNDCTIISEGSENIVVHALSARDVFTLAPQHTKLDGSMLRDHYIEYSLIENNAVISNGTCMLCPPKQFRFLQPEIQTHIDKIGDVYRLSVTSKNFAKGVLLDFDEFDCIFGDNWFDLHGQPYYMILNKSALPENFTEAELGDMLKGKSYYDIITSR